MHPFLARACGGDTELAREVESFLAQEERLEGFIEEPLLPLAAWAEEDAPDAVEVGELETLEEGRRVGPYRLVRLLDGGTTAEGTPYFVMEQIEGQPIDRWSSFG